MKHASIPILILVASSLSAGATLAQSTTPTDASLSALASSGANSYSVRQYFPKPPAGEVLINEFSHTGTTPYSVQRYRRIPDSTPSNLNDDKFYLEDYTVDPANPNNLIWEDTWVYTFVTTSSDPGVHEIQDSLRATTTPQGVYVGIRYTDQTAQPLHHGNVLAKTVLTNGTYPPSIERLAQGTWTQLNSQGGVHATGTFTNNYRIWLVDIKTTVTLPGGTFANVAMQNEQQVISTSGTFNYRFYLAPGRGIIATQYYDANFQFSIANPLIYLSKTCGKGSATDTRPSVSNTLFRCP